VDLKNLYLLKKNGESKTQTILTEICRNSRVSEISVKKDLDILLESGQIESKKYSYYSIACAKN
jgi:hypothetical protein